MAATVRIVLGLGTAAVAQSLLRKLLKRWTDKQNFGGLESELLFAYCWPAQCQWPQLSVLTAAALLVQQYC
jgi:hypothetical protein